MRANQLTGPRIRLAQGVTQTYLFSLFHCHFLSFSLLLQAVNPYDCVKEIKKGLSALLVLVGNYTKPANVNKHNERQTGFLNVLPPDVFMRQLISAQ